MNQLDINSSERLLRMKTKEQYKHQADSYHRSDTYKRMVQLYPVLKNSIGECQGEELVI